MLLQVTEISNVKCVTRLPKETKRQAVAIIFTDDSARTFTCDSGEELGLQTSLQPPLGQPCFSGPVGEGRAGLALAGMRVGVPLSEQAPRMRGRQAKFTGLASLPHRVG